MTEYAEVATSDYLSNLEKWHRDTSWICYGKRRSFSVYEIAACAYGNEEGSVLKPGEKTKKDVYQRLIPYIVCGGRIPQDIVNQLFIELADTMPLIIKATTGKELLTVPAA